MKMIENENLTETQVLTCDVGVRIQSDEVVRQNIPNFRQIYSSL
jgi:hypothetical protein